MMKAWTRWQDWVTLALGVILFVSPWIFGPSNVASISWNAWIVGIIAVVLALLSLALPANPATEWVTLAAGVWLFVSTWILGFAAVSSAAWVAWIIGVLLVIAAGWVLWEERNTHPQLRATA